MADTVGVIAARYRWGVATAVVIAAVGLSTGAANSAYGQRRPSPKIVVVTPVTPSGLAPGYTIASTHDGVCSDNKTARSWVAHGLLICSFKRETYVDPCWVEQITRNGTVRSVVCPLRPWSKALIRINLRRPVDYIPPSDSATMHARHPWGIELASGLRCNGTFHGTTSGYHGRFTRYPCPGTRRVALYPFVRSRSVWRTKTVRFTHRSRRPFGDPRPDSISAVYVARAGNPQVVDTQLPFTGPHWPLSLIALIGVVALWAGGALQRTTMRI